MDKLELATAMVFGEGAPFLVAKSGIYVLSNTSEEVTAVSLDLKTALGSFEDVRYIDACPAEGGAPVITLQSLKFARSPEEQDLFDQGYRWAQVT